MKKLFIDYHPKRVCVAMTENNELKEYYVEKATKPKIVGNIYKGKRQYLAGNESGVCQYRA